MTDRELLELAARAAGICSYLWNPLCDLGDALRLLQHIGNEYGAVITIGSGTNVDVYGVEGCNTYEQGRDLAATMRAITRAAAEIGRAK